LPKNADVTHSWWGPSCAGGRNPTLHRSPAGDVERPTTRSPQIMMSGSHLLKFPFSLTPLLPYFRVTIRCVFQIDASKNRVAAASCTCFVSFFVRVIFFVEFQSFRRMRPPGSDVPVVLLCAAVSCTSFRVASIGLTSLIGRRPWGPYRASTLVGVAGPRRCD